MKNTKRKLTVGIIYGIVNCTILKLPENGWAGWMHFTDSGWQYGYYENDNFLDESGEILGSPLHWIDNESDIND